MPRAWVHTCLFLSWIAANGLQWDVLQWVAWTKMFVGYTQQMSWSAAVEQTFDREKPCEMCRAITAARESEREQREREAVSQDPGSKVLLACQIPAAFSYLKFQDRWDRVRQEPFAPWIEAVPVPPPRRGESHNG